MLANRIRHKYRVLIKNCVFSQLTATHPLHVEEQLILARDLSVQVTNI